MNYQIQAEEFYVANIRKGTEPLGKEKSICDCGGNLKTTNIFYEDGVSQKICTKCGEEHFIYVSF